MPDVVIVGGGVAGLAAARALHKRGIPFLLLEESGDFGGVVRTAAADGFLGEGGPDALLAQKQEGLALCRELGLGDRLVPTNPEKRAVYVLLRRRLHPLPEGMMLAVPTRIGPFLTSRLFSWPGKLRMGLDLVIPPRRGDGDESIASFLGRRFGRECVERLGEPLLAGIHSGDPARLSMRLTFPRFLDLERRHGSLIRGLWSTPPPPAGGAPRAAFYSLTGGLTELIDALVASLPRGSLHAGVSVVRVRRDRDGLLVDRDGDTPLVAKAVLLATPPARAARLVAALDEELSRSLESIPAVSTATVLLGFRREDVAHPLEGYGMLVPRSEGLRTTAVTFSSTKFPGRAPAGHVLLRGFLGGARDPDVLELDDDALVSTLRSEMREVLGLRGEPVFVRVFRWPGGTPQLEVGHLGRLARIESRSLSVPGLFLAGAGLRATGIPDVVADATRTAGALAAAVGPLIQGASRDRSLG